MNHLKQIAAKLPEYHIDAMLCSSEPGEFYAVGLHGEGYAIVTPHAALYVTDSRYIEHANKTVESLSVWSISMMLSMPRGLPSVPRNTSPTSPRFKRWGLTRK